MMYASFTREYMLLNPKIHRETQNEPKSMVFFVLNEAFDFLDGGEVFARIRDFILHPTPQISSDLD